MSVGDPEPQTSDNSRACRGIRVSMFRNSHMCTMEAIEEVEIARNIASVDITFFSNNANGGGAGYGAAIVAVTAQAEVAVTWKSQGRGSGPHPWTSTFMQPRIPGAWTRPFSTLRPADEIARAHEAVHAGDRRCPSLRRRLCREGARPTSPARFRPDPRVSLRTPEHQLLFKGFERADGSEEFLPLWSDR